MNQNSIDYIVFKIVCEAFDVDPEGSDISLEQLKEVFYLDSVSVIHVVSGLEAFFNIAINDEDVDDNFSTSFDRIVELVRNKLADKQAETRK